MSLPLGTGLSGPKYSDPLGQIPDLAGVRLITFFPRTIPEVCAIVQEQFEITEQTDKGEAWQRGERFGYESIQFLIRLDSSRTELPEYVRFAGLICELQVRTILQQAWTELEHDIPYKSIDTIPQAIRRRFMALAGLLEIADREFQSIQDEDECSRQARRREVGEGRFEQVEITPDSLKTYLDHRLGPDLRMSSWSYDFAVQLLHQLGFTTLAEVDRCIAQLDDDRIGRILWGGRPGQFRRFEGVLLAAMGENFIERHPFRHSTDWFLGAYRQYLRQLREAGLPVGNFQPGAADGGAVPD
jgi:hypothetical protein